MVRRKARRAADVRPLPAKTLLSLPAEWLKALCITLHPSVGLVQSRFPIVTIWENNQSDDENRMIDRWSAEAALVARPFLEVESAPLATRRICIHSRPIRSANRGNGGAGRNCSHI